MIHYSSSVSFFLFSLLSLTFISTNASFLSISTLSQPLPLFSILVPSSISMLRSVRWLQVMSRAIDHYKVSLLHLMKSMLVHSTHAKYVQEHQLNHTHTEVLVGTWLNQYKWTEWKAGRWMDSAEHICVFYLTLALIHHQTSVSWLFSPVSLCHHDWFKVVFDS